ncbi:hypothetical protein V1282_003561 [Nitrobacteraceae bacterium AZCC 2146]
MSWANDDMVLYHGCSEESLAPGNPRGIVVTGQPHNISLDVGASLPDFGPGFYTTTWLHQARNWANLRVRKLQARRRIAKAVVLSMRVERNAFAGLQSLVFPGERDGFYKFVEYCRDGRRPHAAIEFRQGPYDVVTGPVTLAGQTMIVGGADQVSFHTLAGTAAISRVDVHGVGDPLFDVST